MSDGNLLIIFLEDEFGQNWRMSLDKTGGDG